MKPQNAAALVAAGMVSVLVYPLLGLRWLRKGSRRPAGPACPACPSGRTASEHGHGGARRPGGSRRAHLREWRRESLWLWPAVAAIGAWVAGDIAARYLHSFTLHQGLFPTEPRRRPDAARDHCRRVPPSPASCSPSPRRTRDVEHLVLTPRLGTFVRKPVTKLSLATFLATFVYSLDVALPDRHNDRGAHGPAGSRWPRLSARDVLCAGLRRLRAFHGAIHAGELCDSGRLQRDVAGDARHV